MSLRPSGDTMQTILRNYKGSPMVYSILAGTALPDGLVAIHEHSDHYSMQVTRPTDFTEFNDMLTKLLQACPAVTKDEFLAAADDEDNQDN